MYDGHNSRRRRIRSSGRFLNILILSSLTKYFFFGLVGFVVLFFIYFLWVSRDLPTPGKLANSQIKDSTKILDKKGDVLYAFYRDYNRLYVPLSDIPKIVEQATISVEDQDFYSNQGFSIRGYFRVIKDFILYRRVTGGSGITQQLVKTALLSPERSISRKLKELILAIQVDQRFSKDQILEMYLNNISYGGTAIGIEAASNLYFNKHVKDLGLPESAFLAGLPQAPSYYSPLVNKDKTYIERSKQVLKRLREDGHISRKQEGQALLDIKKFEFKQRSQGNIKAPHFVMHVRGELNRLFGESAVENGNLTVRTTLDYDIEKKAEEIVGDEIDKLKNFNVGNGAAVVMDPKTGAILAMVGSKNFFDINAEGNFNAATSLRQPGSSLKPVMYATALEKGYTASSMIMDLKTEFPTGDPEHPTYTPVNYDGKYLGPMQLRFALGNSINVPAVKMLAKVGIKPVMQKAYEMGIENWKPTTQSLNSVGFSLILGGREASLVQVSSAYSVFANNGIKKEPFAIVEVKDRNGKTIYKHKDQQGAKILSSEVAFIISHILLDNNAREQVFGTNSYLVIPGKTVAAKTGTTDSKRDNWAVGYTPSIVVGVWVGNNDNSPMNPKIASGATGASPIWHNIMRYVLKNKKNEDFAKPDNVQAVTIDAFSGGAPIDGQATRVEYFLKGTEPTGPAPIYKKIKISKKQTDKLANPDEISHGDYDLKDFIVFLEADPISTDGKNRWQEAIDAWVNEAHKDDSLYRPPTATSDYKYDSDSEEDPTSTPTGLTTPTPSPTGSTPTP